MHESALSAPADPAFDDLALSPDDDTLAPPAVQVDASDSRVVLHLDPGLSFVDLRAAVRRTLDAHEDLRNQGVSLGFSDREVALFDLRRLTRLLADEYDLTVASVFVTERALLRYAQTVLKVQLAVVGPDRQFDLDGATPLPGASAHGCLAHAECAGGPAKGAPGNDEVCAAVHPTVDASLPPESAPDLAPPVCTALQGDAEEEPLPGRGQAPVEEPAQLPLAQLPLAQLPLAQLPLAQLPLAQVPSAEDAAAEQTASGIDEELVAVEPAPTVHEAADSASEPAPTPTPVRAVPDEEPARVADGRIAVQTVHRTLRSGARVRHAGDIIVFGDVNAGAQVIADGNIVVLGALRGLAHAGARGDERASVVAFELRPTQVRIATRIALAPDREPDSGPRLLSLLHRDRTPSRSFSPEIARIEGDSIVFEAFRGRLPSVGR